MNQAGSLRVNLDRESDSVLSCKSILDGWHFAILAAGYKVRRKHRFRCSQE